MGIKDEMPLLARHEGQWAGTYTFIDRQNRIVDQHESHLTCTFPEDGDVPYFQINQYRWPDGREERIEFPGSYADGKLHFDTERINGYCWEIDDHCIVLTWHYQEDPTVSLYELIYLDESGKHRTRTWHWFKDGQCFQRTLVDERKVS